MYDYGRSSATGSTLHHTMIRDFDLKDSFDIEDIHAKNPVFPLPNFNSPVNILQKTMLVDGKVVGTAFVHLTAEIGMVLDLDLPRLTRAKLISELFGVLLQQMSQTELEDYHIYVVPESDEHYVEFLKNFGFVRDKGISLTRFNNEQSKSECSPIVSNELDESGTNSNRPN